jgi:hopanoid biosynthesis associated RND transporter like protein HpnN
MVTSIIVRIVDFCSHRAWMVISAFFIAAVACSFYTARHFAINSDINALLSPQLEWRQREQGLEKAFGLFERIAVVVDAPTPEFAGAATNELVEALRPNKEYFQEVSQPAGGEFFARNGLLFMPLNELKKQLAPLEQAEPLISDLATDQSLRGLTAGLGDVLLGVQSEKVSLDSVGPTLDKFSTAIEDVVAGRQTSFSWRELVQQQQGPVNEKRGFIDVRPILDYAALEPGKVATDKIRAIAAGIAPKYQATVRLTGPVPMADEEFGTIKEGALRNGLITIAIVLFILWMALRSARLILAVFVNVFIGLAITAAIGLAMVGSLNPISMSFAVLFVGIGVDFGIQYSVRYRSERYETKDLMRGIKDAGRLAGLPLTLAAAATAAGFLSFLPTDYRGVSELGLIAGVGMLIAFATSVSVLPALISVLKPPGEPEPMGFSAMAPVDAFLERNRMTVLIGTAIVVIAGLPLLYWLHFDFNPVNLRSPNAESVATYLDLTRDPSNNTNSVGVLASSLQEADAIGEKLSKVSDVGRVTTLSSFIPDQQKEKLGVIGDAARKLADAFDPKNAQKAPSDSENVEALNESVEQLGEIGKGRNGVGADALNRLSAAIAALAKAPPEARKKADEVLVQPLHLALQGLQASLHPQMISRKTLPPQLVADWVTPDGRARVEAAPKGDSNDNATQRKFARDVLAVEPRAIEGPISILEAGDTVVHAFIEAGIWALLSISILLWIVLRRFGDVLLTLVPLLVAGVVTLELCVLIGMPLNFANIIALPLLLGIGVAFKIYYIMAWREGQTNLLQTSLTRAVFFSALTTATAFGSLWFSSHPGTSSMGKLLALSLICTLAAAVLFQPVLMGKPREDTTTTGS